VLKAAYSLPVPGSADRLFEDPAVPSPNKGGRPTLYSPELAEKLCASVRQHGWSDHLAAIPHGLNPANLIRWRAVHEDFEPAIQTARAEFLSTQLEAIAAAETKSGDLNWRARAWLVERTFPHDYGRRASLKVELPEAEDPDDGPFDPSAPGAFAGVITPRKLFVLQCLRLHNLGQLQRQKAAPEAQAAAQLPSPQPPPPRQPDAEVL
jgi:hypothetical protein